MTKHKICFWIESSLVGQKLQIYGPLKCFKRRNQNFWKLEFENLPEVNFFCNQQIAYHKTRYEDIFVRYQCGLNTHTGLLKHQKFNDNTIGWQKKRSF